MLPGVAEVTGGRGWRRGAGQRRGQQYLACAEALRRARLCLENAHVAVTAGVIAVPFCIVCPVVAITANTASPPLS